MKAKPSPDAGSIDYAEGRVIDFQSDQHIATDLLQTFPYDGPKQRITYETSEFSAVCPYSGLPDFGKLVIEYIPRQTIVELKSLKYYLVSWRNVGIFQEPGTARLYQDLWDLLNPQWLCVKTVYNTRGGIDAICEIRSDEQ